MQSPEQLLFYGFLKHPQLTIVNTEVSKSKSSCDILTLFHRKKPKEAGMLKCSRMLLTTPAAKHRHDSERYKPRKKKPTIAKFFTALPM